MRVLWVVNLVPSEVANCVGINTTVLGGWVESMAKQLRKKDEMELSIACKTNQNIKFKNEINNVTYYSISYSAKSNTANIIKQEEEIIDDFNPDIIHIEGTEFIHSKLMLDIGNSKGIKTVVSLQGILNGQYDYQCGQLPMEDMLFSCSITNIMAAWVMMLRKRIWYKSRMKYELETIQKGKYFIGRTTWDRAHTFALNPSAQYFQCHRVLRDAFYDQEWKIKDIKRHSIYVGNGYFPLKGLHYMVMALPMLIREYPDIKLYVAGYKPYQNHDKRMIIKKGYALYLKKLIQELNVEQYIEFTGALDAEQVSDKLRESHVYALCSAVENSPNTLGEAMLIGTPTVTAYVGGVSDMVEDKKESLFFRNNDPAILAWNIKQIFDNDILAEELSMNAKKHALVTHDAKANADKLIEIYQDIMGEAYE